METPSREREEGGGEREEGGGREGGGRGEREEGGGREGGGYVLKLLNELDMYIYNDRDYISHGQKLSSLITTLKNYDLTTR